MTQTLSLKHGNTSSRNVYTCKLAEFVTHTTSDNHTFATNMPIQCFLSAVSLCPHTHTHTHTHTHIWCLCVYVSGWVGECVHACNSNFQNPGSVSEVRVTRWLLQKILHTQIKRNSSNQDQVLSIFTVGGNMSSHLCFVLGRLCWASLDSLLTGHPGTVCKAKHKLPLTESDFEYICTYHRSIKAFLRF